MEPTTTGAEVLQNLERIGNIADDVRRAYRRTFEKEPGRLSRGDIERLIEQTVESHFSAEASDAWLSVDELVAGTALDKNRQKMANLEVLEKALKTEVLEEDNFDIRGKFVRALNGMARGKTAVTQDQLEKAFIIASGNPYPPSQQGFRDGCNHDIDVLKEKLEKIVPGIKLAR